MAALLNQRHEKFAQGLAEGKSATEAYKNAGYASNDGNAARLKGNERIRARVVELQECAAAHVTVTLEGLIDEATDIQAKAMADGKYSAAVAALTVKAKLAGLWVDKAENKANNVVYHISDHPLTPAEWAQKYCTPGENAGE
jgi:phage terminase small subunit